MATRPSFTPVIAGVETWLSDLNDALSALFNSPLPIVSYANTAGFPDAALYEDCLAHAQDIDEIHKSDGTNWIPTPKRGAAIVDSTGWTDSSAQTDFNALLAVLRSANIIQ